MWRMLLRPPTPDDANEVFRVLAARDTADLGAPDVTLEDVLDEWRESGFEPAREACVCEAGGEIVGYATLRRPAAQISVEPRHEGRGIGTRLLAWAEERERELGRERHRQVIAAPNRAAAALLERAGYALAHSYWRMAVALQELPAPTAAPPEGVQLRALRPHEDAVALHALDAEAFAEQPDYDPMTLEVFRDRHLLAHDIVPTLSLVAERGARAVGLLLSRRWEQEHAGYVDVLGVAPAEQHRGLGRAMLERALTGYRDAGLAEAQLGVAVHNPRALALYESVGMRPRFRWDCYERAPSR